MLYINPDEKCCATCHYWKGCRRYRELVPRILVDTHLPPNDACCMTWKYGAKHSACRGYKRWLELPPVCGCGHNNGRK